MILSKCSFNRLMINYNLTKVDEQDKEGAMLILNQYLRRFVSSFLDVSCQFCKHEKQKTISIDNVIRSSITLNYEQLLEEAICMRIPKTIPIYLLSRFTKQYLRQKYPTIRSGKNSTKLMQKIISLRITNLAERFEEVQNICNGSLKKAIEHVCEDTY